MHFYVRFSLIVGFGSGVCFYKGLKSLVNIQTKFHVDGGNKLKTCEPSTQIYSIVLFLSRSEC